MAEDPRVLAAFVQTHLRVMTEQHPALAARVREAMDPAVLKSIETASRISWLPLTHHIALTECICRVGDRELGYTICRQMLLESFSQPFLKPLFRGALAVLGPSLDKFVRWTPKAWYGLYRDVGRLSWLPGDARSCSLRLESAHPLILESSDYIEGIAGSFSAFFEVTNSSGSIRTQATHLNVTFDFTWTPRSR
jgi:hypothetical protein